MTYSISGGADAAKFGIDSLSGALSFTSAPTSAGPEGTSDYQVEVRASDSILSDTQLIIARVVDLNEGGGDQAPVITSNGGTDSAVVTMGERTHVTTFKATDPDGDPVTYSIVGGADAGKFQVDSISGSLDFYTQPDVANPSAANGSNDYQVLVAASDGTKSDSQLIVAHVTNDPNAGGGLADQAPVITSNGGTDAAVVTMGYNRPHVTTFKATDPDGDPLTYSIAGGADADRFGVDSISGALFFKDAPNSANAGSADGTSSYRVEVQVSDGTLSDSQLIVAKVVDIDQGSSDQAPVITSNRGTDAAVVTMEENRAHVTTFHATDPDGDRVTYGITGGADAAKFRVDSVSGSLDFITAPDYENPTSADGSNDYQVVVAASDGVKSDTQLLVAHVTDLPETVSGGSGGTDTGGSGTGTDTGGSDGGNGGAGGGSSTPSGGSGGAPSGGAGFVFTNGADVYTGLSSDEILSALRGDDFVKGGSGNDLIYGNQGNDSLAGNLGNDTLYGGQDNDVVFGGQGNDIVFGNLGADTVFGNLGDDIITGNEGNDIVYGGQGNDTVYGGQGDDTVYGGYGNDVVHGDLGADRFVFGPARGDDRVADFSQAAGDRLDLQGQTFTTGAAQDGSAVLSLSGGGSVTLAGIAPGAVNASFFA